MKKMLLYATLLACGAFFIGTTFVSAASTTYKVYCANGKIEVDSRDLKQMQSARGSGTYMMSEFNYRMDAEKFAKQLGGVGSQCPKR